jgi:hypothetical protein
MVVLLKEETSKKFSERLDNIIFGLVAPSSDSAPKKPQSLNQKLNHLQLGGVPKSQV